MYYFLLLKKKTKYIEFGFMEFFNYCIRMETQKMQRILFQCITNSINQLLNDKKQKIYFSIAAGAIELSKEFLFL